MPYRLQFKGDDDVYSRQDPPLFAKTDNWDRAKSKEHIVGDVAILHAGRVLSSNSLKFEPLDLEPSQSQTFIANWVDGYLTLKSPVGRYLELRSRKVVLDSVAAGPGCQFNATFSQGQVQLQQGLKLDVVENELSASDAGSMFVIIHK